MKYLLKNFIILIIFSILFTGCTLSENTLSVLSKDNNKIVYGTKGEAEIAVVFIHCWTCNYKYWKPQIKYFSDKYKVVWLDLAGHGLSDSKRDNYTISAFAQDVAVVINKLKLEKVVLVGHSMGGPVAIEAAKILDKKVIGIVGVDTFYTPFSYPVSKEDIKKFIKPFEDDFNSASKNMVSSMFTKHADKKKISYILEQFALANQKVGISAMYDFFKWHSKNIPSSLIQFEDRLKNINGTPMGNEKKLHESVHLIPKVGHFVAQMKPDEFNDVLNSMIIEFKK